MSSITAAQQGPSPQQDPAAGAWLRDTSSLSVSLPPNAWNRDLWSQPCPNILLPTSAQCSPKTFPSCGLRNTKTAPCHLNGCKSPLFPIQLPQIPEAQRGERQPCDPTRKVLNNLVSTNGSSKGRHSSISAPTQGFLSSCSETKLACFLSDEAYWIP